MHKKSRSKKGPRHPPQASAQKTTPTGAPAAAELEVTAPPAAAVAEERKEELRVPNPNPEPQPETAAADVATQDVSSSDIPSKPRRHRGGRKKKHGGENKDQTNETATEDIEDSENKTEMKPLETQKETLDIKKPPQKDEIKTAPETSSSEVKIQKEPEVKTEKQGALKTEEIKKDEDLLKLSPAPDKKSNQKGKDKNQKKTAEPKPKEQEHTQQPTKEIKPEIEIKLETTETSPRTGEHSDTNDQKEKKKKQKSSESDTDNPVELKTTNLQKEKNTVQLSPPVAEKRSHSASKKGKDKNQKKVDEPKPAEKPKEVVDICTENQSQEIEAKFEIKAETLQVSLPQEKSTEIVKSETETIKPTESNLTDKQKEKDQNESGIETIKPIDLKSTDIPKEESLIQITPPVAEKRSHSASKKGKDKNQRKLADNFKPIELKPTESQEGGKSLEIQEPKIDSKNVKAAHAAKAADVSKPIEPTSELKTIKSEIADTKLAEPTKPTACEEEEKKDLHIKVSEVKPEAAMKITPEIRLSSDKTDSIKVADETHEIQTIATEPLISVSKQSVELPKKLEPFHQTKSEIPDTFPKSEPKMKGQGKKSKSKFVLKDDERFSETEIDQPNTQTAIIPPASLIIGEIKQFPAQQPEKSDEKIIPIQKFVSDPVIASKDTKVAPDDKIIEELKQLIPIEIPKINTNQAEIQPITCDLKKEAITKDSQTKKKGKNNKSTTPNIQEQPEKEVNVKPITPETTKPEKIVIEPKDSVLTAPENIKVKDVAIETSLDTAFIAGISEILVNPKHIESTPKQVSKDIEMKKEKQHKTEMKLASIDTKKAISPIPFLEKEPQLMICDKIAQKKEEIIKVEKRDKPILLIPELAKSAPTSGLTIAEEIAESIKEELKCQLAIISGAAGDIGQKKNLTKKKIEDIGEETEKNVVKNIESIMKTVDQSISADCSSPASPIISHDIPIIDENVKTEANEPFNRNQPKGKGKSKKGSKKDRVDTNTPTQAQETGGNVQSDTTTTTTEKTKEASEQKTEEPKQTEKSNTSGGKDDYESNMDNVVDDSKDDNFVDAESTEEFECVNTANERDANVKCTQDSSKDGEKSTLATRSKNLLGRPNIPVSSNKVDYKKEKDKCEESPDARNTITKLLSENNHNLPEVRAEQKDDKNRKVKIKKESQIRQENVDSDDDEEEYVYKYNFRNVFLANICHVCKSSIVSCRVSCEYCGLVSYCSSNHKDTDWPHHQALCYAVSTIMQINGLKHLYSKSSALSGHEFRILRMQMIVLCEKLLKRKLLPSEQETLLYPRLCIKDDCKEWQREKLADCEKCGQISYCKQHVDHLQADHKDWCQSYKIYHELVVHQLVKGKVEPKLPSRILPQGYLMPDNCAQLMKALYNNSVSMDDCHYATLSQLSTAPLTALYSYQLWKMGSGNKDGFQIPSKLSIHIVGAEMQFEMDTLNKWEVFFLHLYPRLEELTLVFVGPELNASQLPLDLMSRIRLCKFCRQTSKNIKIQFHDGILYHDFVEGPSFTTPDLVCAFNPGLHRTTGFAGQDTWPDTIRSIANLTVPFCVTSYTKHELPRDLTRVLGCTNGNVKTHVAPTLNPYASLRPDRNFISDDEMPLIFKNYYFMVLSGLPS